jgi:hypothetical protein
VKVINLCGVVAFSVMGNSCSIEAANKLGSGESVKQLVFGEGIPQDSEQSEGVHASAIHLEEKEKENSECLELKDLKKMLETHLCKQVLENHSREKLLKEYLKYNELLPNEVVNHPRERLLCVLKRLRYKLLSQGLVPSDNNWTSVVPKNRMWELRKNSGYNQLLKIFNFCKSRGEIKEKNCPYARAIMERQMLITPEPRAFFYNTLRLWRISKGPDGIILNVNIQHVLDQREIEKNSAANNKTIVFANSATPSGQLLLFVREAFRTHMYFLAQMAAKALTGDKRAVKVSATDAARRKQIQEEHGADVKQTRFEKFQTNKPHDCFGLEKLAKFESLKSKDQSHLTKTSEEIAERLRKMKPGKQSEWVMAEVQRAISTGVQKIYAGKQLPEAANEMFAAHPPFSENCNMSLDEIKEYASRSIEVINSLGPVKARKQKKVQSAAEASDEPSREEFPQEEFKDPLPADIDHAKVRMNAIRNFIIKLRQQLNACHEKMELDGIQADSVNIRALTEIRTQCANLQRVNIERDQAHHETNLCFRNVCDIILSNQLRGVRFDLEDGSQNTASMRTDVSQKQFQRKTMSVKTRLQAQRQRLNDLATSDDLGAIVNENILGKIISIVGNTEDALFKEAFDYYLSVVGRRLFEQITTLQTTHRYDDEQIVRFFASNENIQLPRHYIELYRNYCLKQVVERTYVDQTSSLETQQIRGDVSNHHRSVFLRVIGGKSKHLLVKYCIDNNIEFNKSDYISRERTNVSLFKHQIELAEAFACIGVGENDVNISKNAAAFIATSGGKTSTIIAFIRMLPYFNKLRLEQGRPPLVFVFASPTNYLSLCSLAGISQSQNASSCHVPWGYFSPEASCMPSDCDRENGGYVISGTPEHLVTDIERWIPSARTEVVMCVDESHTMYNNPAIKKLLVALSQKEKPCTISMLTAILLTATVSKAERKNLHSWLRLLTGKSTTEINSTSRPVRIELDQFVTDESTGKFTVEQRFVWGNMTAGNISQRDLYYMMQRAIVCENEKVQKEAVQLLEQFYETYNKGKITMADDLDYYNEHLISFCGRVPSIIPEPSTKKSTIQDLVTYLLNNLLKERSVNTLVFVQANPYLVMIEVAKILDSFVQQLYPSLPAVRMIMHDQAFYKAYCDYKQLRDENADERKSEESPVYDRWQAAQSKILDAVKRIMRDIQARHDASPSDQNVIAEGHMMQRLFDGVHNGTLLRAASECEYVPEEFCFGTQNGDLDKISKYYTSKPNKHLQLAITYGFGYVPDGTTDNPLHHGSTIHENGMSGRTVHNVIELYERGTIQVLFTSLSRYGQLIVGVNIKALRVAAWTPEYNPTAEFWYLLNQALGRGGRINSAGSCKATLFFPPPQVKSRGNIVNFSVEYEDSQVEKSVLEYNRRQLCIAEEADQTAETEEDMYNFIQRVAAQEAEDVKDEPKEEMKEELVSPLAFDYIKSIRVKQSSVVFQFLQNKLHQLTDQAHKVIKRDQMQHVSESVSYDDCDDPEELKIIIKGMETEYARLTVEKGSVEIKRKAEKGLDGETNVQRRWQEIKTRITELNLDIGSAKDKLERMNEIPDPDDVSDPEENARKVAELLAKLKKPLVQQKSVSPIPVATSPIPAATSSIPKVQKKKEKLDIERTFVIGDVEGRQKREEIETQQREEKRRRQVAKENAQTIDVVPVAVWGDGTIADKMKEHRDNEEARHTQEALEKRQRDEIAKQQEEAVRIQFELARAEREKTDSFEIKCHAFKYAMNGRRMSLYDRTQETCERSIEFLEQKRERFEQNHNILQNISIKAENFRKAVVQFINADPKTTQTLREEMIVLRAQLMELLPNVYKQRFECANIYDCCRIAEKIIQDATLDIAVTEFDLWRNCCTLEMHESWLSGYTLYWTTFSDEEKEAYKHWFKTGNFKHANTTKFEPCKINYDELMEPEPFFANSIATLERGLWICLKPIKASQTIEVTPQFDKFMFPILSGCWNMRVSHLPSFKTLFKDLVFTVSETNTLCDDTKMIGTRTILRCSTLSSNYKNILFTYTKYTDLTGESTDSDFPCTTKFNRQSMKLQLLLLLGFNRFKKHYQVVKPPVAPIVPIVQVQEVAVVVETPRSVMSEEDAVFMNSTFAKGATKRIVSGASSAPRRMPVKKVAKKQLEPVAAQPTEDFKSAVNRFKRWFSSTKASIQVHNNSSSVDHETKEACDDSTETNKPIESSVRQNTVRSLRDIQQSQLKLIKMQSSSNLKAHTKSVNRANQQFQISLPTASTINRMGGSKSAIDAQLREIENGRVWTISACIPDAPIMDDAEDADALVLNHLNNRRSVVSKSSQLKQVAQLYPVVSSAQLSIDDGWTMVGPKKASKKIGTSTTQSSVPSWTASSKVVEQVYTPLATVANSPQIIEADNEALIWNSRLTIHRSQERSLTLSQQQKRERELLCQWFGFDCAKPGNDLYDLQARRYITLLNAALKRRNDLKQAEIKKEQNKIVDAEARAALIKILSEEFNVVTDSDSLEYLKSTHAGLLSERIKNRAPTSHSHLKELLQIARIDWAILFMPITDVKHRCQPRKIGCGYRCMPIIKSTSAVIRRRIPLKLEDAKEREYLDLEVFAAFLNKINWERLNKCGCITKSKTSQMDYKGFGFEEMWHGNKEDGTYMKEWILFLGFPEEEYKKNRSINMRFALFDRLCAERYTRACALTANPEQARAMFVMKTETFIQLEKMQTWTKVYKSATEYVQSPRAMTPTEKEPIRANILEFFKVMAPSCLQTLTDKKTGKSMCFVKKESGFAVELEDLYNVFITKFNEINSEEKKDTFDETKDRESEREWAMKVDVTSVQQVPIQEVAKVTTTPWPEKPIRQSPVAQAIRQSPVAPTTRQSPVAPTTRQSPAAPTTRQSPAAQAISVKPATPVKSRPQIMSADLDCNASAVPVPYLEGIPPEEVPIKTKALIKPVKPVKTVPISIKENLLVKPIKPVRPINAPRSITHPPLTSLRELFCSESSATPQLPQQTPVSSIPNTQGLAGSGILKKKLTYALIYLCGSPSAASKAAGLKNLSSSTPNQLKAAFDHIQQSIGGGKSLLTYEECYKLQCVINEAANL